MKNMVTIINQDSVVTYLNQVRRDTKSAQLVEDIRYSIGFKGKRFTDYILTQTLYRILDSQLVREIECEVVQHMVETDKIYYVGVLPHDVE